MRTITVVRNKGLYGIWRAAVLLADDVEIGRVRHGCTVEMELPEHTENLFVKMDWGWSAPYPAAAIRDGQTIYVNAWFTFKMRRLAGLELIPMAIEDQPR